MRLLVVLPSWIGDAVMATPTLRVLREHLPGAFIGALARPGIDDLLRGCNFFDEVHVAVAQGVMGPKRAAAKIRPRRYDAAVLLTNSFSTALTTRLAGIRRRFGYDRDARGLLLTDPLTPLRRRDVEPYSRSNTAPAEWAPIPACEYYYSLARVFLEDRGVHLGPMGPLELIVNKSEELAATDILSKLPALQHAKSNENVREGLNSPEARPQSPLVILNPGGNDPAKRWPADRFAALADYLVTNHHATVLVSGAPSERELVDSIVAEAASRSPQSAERIVNAARLGVNIGSLKALIARARLLVTNDTGPRHIAAALGTPCVVLFGPTDHRWTTIPAPDEVRILADPTLPDEEVANDHPDRCKIDRIGTGDVVAAVNRLLTGAAAH